VTILSTEPKQRKVTFVVDADAWHGHSSETLWVDDLGNNAFRLANVPFFAKGISFGDVISAKANGGELEFDSVVSRGGHSTCRVVTGSAAIAKNLSQALRDLLCQCETGRIADLTVLAVDVAPEARVADIADMLEAGRVEKKWDWEAGHDGHPQ
jgi:hypothetical protein